MKYRSLVIASLENDRTNLAIFFFFTVRNSPNKVSGTEKARIVARESKLIGKKAFLLVIVYLNIEK